jgi:hypothetical protein
MIRIRTLNGKKYESFDSNLSDKGEYYQITTSFLFINSEVKIQKTSIESISKFNTYTYIFKKILKVVVPILIFLFIVFLFLFLFLYMKS